MKKCLALCFALILACIPFAACSKKSTPATNEKDFAIYFPIAILNTGNQKSEKTESILNSKQAFYSISFVANEAWTNEIFANNIEFEIIANENVDVDFLVTLKTNNEQEIIPCVCTTTEGTAKILITPSKELIGETRIDIALTLPGGHGIDGMIYDKTDALTGFIWGISKINFKAEHK